MADLKNTLKKPHTLSLENRRVLSLEGVVDVGSFDTESVVLYTELGALCLRGQQLHISKLSLETGQVVIDGEISAMIYSDSTGKGQGLIKRLFK